MNSPIENFQPENMFAKDFDGKRKFIFAVLFIVDVGVCIRLQMSEKTKRKKKSMGNLFERNGFLTNAKCLL